ncbi:HD domain-containing phosphohydrolase [Vibrio coralliilyticus]|uniref:HD domain-containing phosphohydrolase n=1 Tax=Vibrio coralliilyticus TaxID=190893 RepID=UPI000BAB1CB4|nr:HD domain-containing phosphohydrolase [Vibrio coralliilyticus]NOI60819.1 response regulator [Vibrio coralliilyticus]PAT69679.1 response regulator [Vibrio coralliilyticus]
MDGDTAVKLIIVDSEVQITRALSRLLRKDFSVVTFNDPISALTYLNDYEVSIVVADSNMPSMSSSKFFYEARYVQPGAIRVALSSNAEQNDLTAFINEGDVSYVLPKPWENEEVKKTLLRLKSQFEMTGGIEKYAKHQEAINAKLLRDNESLQGQIEEKNKHIKQLDLKYKSASHRHKELMNNTLSLLVNVISESVHVEKQDLLRIAEHVKELAGHITSSEVSNDQAYQAALLHLIGMVSCQSKQQLSSAYTAHHIGPCGSGHKAADLLLHNVSFQPLLAGIQYQDENMDGTGFPEGLKGEQIPVLSRIIRVVKDYDYLTVNHVDRTKLRLPAVAESLMKEKSKSHYDPLILNTYFHILEDKRRNNTSALEYCVSIGDLKPGIEIKRDVSLPNGKVLIKRGSRLNQEMLDRLFELEEFESQNFVYVI